MLSEPLQAIAQAGDLADSTKAQYSRVWRHFEQWAEDAGAELPSTDAVASYLDHLAQNGRKIASINAALAGIRKAHLLMDWPSLKVRVVVETHGRLRRQVGGPQKQAMGLTEECLAAIMASARDPIVKRGGKLETAEEARARGDVDIALVCLMRDSMLRISEAADLHWRDVFPQSDGTGRLVVNRSKTDKYGEGQMTYVGVRAMAALAVLRPSDAAPDSPVFGGESRWALTRRISRVCRQAGLGDGYSGHSPRVGFAQDLVASGVELPALMQAGRWKGPEMPARYTAHLALSRGAVATYYGESAPAGSVASAVRPLPLPRRDPQREEGWRDMSERRSTRRQRTRPRPSLRRRH